MVAKSLPDVERRALLEAIARIEPDADLAPGGIARVFLPLPEYKRVLDDRVVLILGDRGVGKSALFHFLQTEGRRAIESGSAPPHDWIVGFAEATMDHPQPLALQQLVEGSEAEAEKVSRTFWLGHLAGRIADSVGSAVAPPPAVDRWRASPMSPKEWLAAFADPTDTLLWLDQVERHLQAERRVLVVIYDHLDRIGVRNREARRRLLPPLLALWLSFSNRFRAIRAKLFLRQDLFEESIPHTADVSKLQARSETIRWTNAALYRLLIRHLAESDDALRSWISTGVKRIQLTESPLLGWLPPDDLPETGPASQQAFMEHLVGKTMGKPTEPRAGYTYKWVPAYLADAHHAVAPRSMITLFKSAAKQALSKTPGAGYLRLLTAEEMKEGLRDTSSQRVRELAEEHPVVNRLRQLGDQILPIGNQDVRSLISTPPADHQDEFGTSGDRVLEELERLGVVARVSKDRVDIPDIFRLHFGIRRKGSKVGANSRSQKR